MSDLLVVGVDPATPKEPGSNKVLAILRCLDWLTRNDMELWAIAANQSNTRKEFNRIHGLNVPPSLFKHSRELACNWWKVEKVPPIPRKIDLTAEEWLANRRVLNQYSDVMVTMSLNVLIRFVNFHGGVMNSEVLPGWTSFQQAKKIKEST